MDYLYSIGRKRKRPPGITKEMVGQLNSAEKQEDYTEHGRACSSNLGLHSGDAVGAKPQIQGKPGRSPDNRLAILTTGETRSYPKS